MVFEITILGSSSALPTSQRYPAAHVLNAHERFYLIDCGEGTQMQLRKNRIRLGKINNIFISHMHGDHIFGLYGLLSTLNLTGRKTPINIFAAEQFGPIMQSHLNDFDLHLKFDLIFHPLKGDSPSLIFTDKIITVTSIPLRHRIPTYGFLFREKQKERNIIKESLKEYRIPLISIPGIKRGEDFITGSGKVIPNREITNDPPIPRSYAYCSDTSYFKQLSQFVRGVDLLYHEATFGSELADLARQTGHSTSIEAATVARDAEAKKLVIGHFSARYKSVELLVEEARSVFKETIAAQDGAVITI
ncbi:MAG: ribonuclease Z [Bacteroidales bacterium]|nr:ribonuclease Z [Bacteroidales bacterium]